jgi:hypothetical protein
MGFAELFRNGVALIDSLTEDLQVTVQHYAWASNDGKGRDTFNPPLTGAGTNRQAVVDYTQKQRARADGRLVNVVATVIFPRPVIIGPLDVIKLPDGTTGPILNSPNSVLDPATGAGYFAQVELGEVA